MTNTIEHSKTHNASEVRVAAYQMWERAGHPAGRDLQSWLDAEAQVRMASKLGPLKPTAHQSAVDSKTKPADKAANERSGPVQRNSAKPQPMVNKF